MRLFTSVILILINCSFLAAQDLEKRYSFAKAYAGLDMLYVPAYGESSYLDNNELVGFQRKSFLNPAINLGATHFWGFTDLYVSVTTNNIRLADQPVATSTRFGAITGIRLYPLALTDHTVRPFLGYKFSPIRYRQEDIEQQAHLHTRVKSTFDIGIGIRKPGVYAYLAYNRILNPGLTTYLSRSVITDTQYPSHYVSLGVNLMFETTAGSYQGKEAKLDSLLRKSNRYGLFFGIGPSSAFPLVSSDYITENYPFLDDLTMPAIFPDLSLGYHFSRFDMSLALSFRPMVQRREAFEFEQKTARNSLALETYKYLTDYHGFAPFIGLGVSSEWLSLQETNDEIRVRDEQQHQFSWVLVTGWDIRPSRLADTFLLRTNIRYSPQLYLSPENKKLSLQHLEFNFIQFIFYPLRKKALKTL